jgi:hypothetical protein
MNRWPRRTWAIWPLIAVALMMWQSPAAFAQSTDASATHGRHLADGVGYVSLLRLDYQSNKTNNGRLLLAFEQAGMKGIPLYESGSDGKHWTLVTHVTDQVHKHNVRWQLRWQPNLTEMPRASGPLKKGTLLLAANATRNDATGRVVVEQLQLYASTDLGRTWQYRGTIVKGGAPAGSKDNNGVWEPTVHILDDGRMVAYYSSEQHKAEGYNQVLAHKVSTDGGRTWGPEAIDVAIPGGVERPGMAVVDRLPGGRYVMSYEDIDGPHNGQVFLKFSRDGLDWGDSADHGTPVRTEGGAWPAACPVVHWFPEGGANGVLVVSAERAGGSSNAAGHKLYWNNNLGRGPWWEVPAPVQKRTGNIHAGWTQALMFRHDGELLQITSSSSPAHPDVAADNEIIYGAAPVSFNRYEAEDGARTSAAAIRDADASNGGLVRIAARPHGQLSFDIDVTHGGAHTLRLRYRDLGLAATPQVSVDGAHLVSHSGKPDGKGWKIMTMRVKLLAGSNTITIGGANHVFDLDYIQLSSLAGH